MQALFGPVQPNRPWWFGCLREGVEVLLVLKCVHGSPEAVMVLREELPRSNQTRERLLDKLRR
jgi:hypothetical protein